LVVISDPAFKQGKFFLFFTLQLCRRDLKIPVCLLTGYNNILIDN